jgi:hypothetical protein
MFIQTDKGDTSISYLCDWQYSKFRTPAQISQANDIAIFFMLFDRKVYGHQKFDILDSALFRKNNKKGITISFKNTDSSNTIGFSQLCIWYTIQTNNCKWVGNCNGYQGECDWCWRCVISEDFMICNWVASVSPAGDNFGGGGTPPPDNGSGSNIGGSGNNDVAVPPSNNDGLRPGWRKFNTPVFDPNNPWDDIDNPYNAKDDPINFDVSGIEVGKKYDIDNPPPIIRRVGFSKRTPPNIEDMESGTNGDISGIFIPPYFNKWDGSLKFITDPSLTDDELFHSMDVLFSATTIFSSDLRKVSIEMRQKFRDGWQGGPYKNDILNEKVSESTEMIDYIESFRKLFSVELKKANGNILSTNEIDMQKLRPKFSSLHHKFHGLQILINDTETTNIMMYDYTIDSNGNWEAEVVFEITDHFGLDKNDVLTYQTTHRGFVAWWALQHKRDYKPFLTKIYVTRKLKGKI